MPNHRLDSSGFFFDVLKWFGSMAASRLTFAEKGVYLVMLFQEWRDDERSLPDNPEDVADLIAITPEQCAEVAAAWPAVRRFFTDLDQESPGRVINETLERTRRTQRKYFQKKRAAGQKGGKVSAGKRQAPKEIVVEHSLSTAQRQSSDLKEKEKESRSDQTRSDQRRDVRRATDPPVDGRSKRPVYTSDRFDVFEWQLDELGKTLGSHLDDFDLHAFFDDLTQRTRRDGIVIPSDRDARWRWLQAEVEAEARRRQLPMASVADGRNAVGDDGAWAEIAAKGPSVRR